MDIVEYAKSHFFIKMIDRGSIWEIYMQSMLNRSGQYVNIEGKPVPYSGYMVHIRKKEGYTR